MYLKVVQFKARKTFKSCFVQSEISVKKSKLKQSKLKTNLNMGLNAFAMQICEHIWLAIAYIFLFVTKFLEKTKTSNVLYTF